MRRMRYHEYGGPDVLRLEYAAVPEPGPGQVLIKAEVIGTNFVDTKIRQGPGSGSIFQRPLPGKPTGDVVGIISALGPEVDGYQVGDRVAALAEDAYADMVVADAAWLAPVPTNQVEAATILPTAAPVALRVLRAGGVSAGSVVLVHSAAGTIGHLAVQLAKLLGAGTVIATASSPAKLDFARAHGADLAFDYTAPDWSAQILDAVPQGVDVVLDAGGGDVLRQSLDTLAPYGRVVTYGAASGELVDIPVTDLFALKSVAGFSLMAWRAARPAEARAEMTELANLITTNQLRLSTRSTLPLPEAAEAHRLLESRITLGRVLLQP